jgi:tetraacyldisaccharide 4'-kinase
VSRIPPVVGKLLLPLSWLFGLIVWIRNWFYDQGILPRHRLPGVVISVGNIAVGGTGKSPLVIDLTRRIIAAGGAPAIVCRGYRSGLAAGESQLLMDGRVIAGVSRSGVMADEARMQSLALPGVPVIVGARRFEAVTFFVASGLTKPVSHWIIDDGFQHRAIHRDQDIVVADARCVQGDLLPAGLFRESLTALKRADVVVLTKATADSEVAAAKALIARVAPKCPVYVASFETEPPRQVAGPPVSPSPRWALVTAIARPADFQRSLIQKGILTGEVFIYPDHQTFNAARVLSRSPAFDAVITTEKDWARDEAKFVSLNHPVFVLPQTLLWRDGREPGLVLKDPS